MEIRKYDEVRGGLTDGLAGGGARDACASKRFVKIDIAQKAIIMIMITIIQKSSLMLWLIILPDEFYLWKTTGCRWNVCIDLVCLPSSEQTHRGTTR